MPRKVRHVVGPSYSWSTIRTPNWEHIWSRVAMASAHTVELGGPMTIVVQVVENVFDTPIPYAPLQGVGAQQRPNVSMYRIPSHARGGPAGGLE